MDNKIENKKLLIGRIVANVIILSIIVTLLIVLLISYLRKDKGNEFRESDLTKNIGSYLESKNLKIDVSSWIKAIQDGDQKKAIFLANKIVPHEFVKLPQGDYMQLFLRLKISTLIVTTPFNEFDYFRWRDAFLINSIVYNVDSKNLNKDVETSLTSAENKNCLLNKSLTKDYNKKSIIELFNNMMSRIEVYKKTPLKYKNGLTLYDIWNKKRASVSELCRLFASIGKESGYDAAIVLIFSKERQLLHIYCELRKDRELFITDPRFKFITNISNPKPISPDIHEKPILWSANIADCAFRKFYEYPAEFADYKIINQKLYNRLNFASKSKIPLFGQSPSGEIDRYIDNYGNKNENNTFSYWTFPFNSLKYSNSFPLLWKLKFKSSSNSTN